MRGYAAEEKQVATLEFKCFYKHPFGGPFFQVYFKYVDFIVNHLQKMMLLLYIFSLTFDLQER